MNSHSIKVIDLPVQLKNEIRDDIAPYSIGLVGVLSENNQKSATLLGSGTLIKFNEHYGILTANHVVDSRYSDAFGKSEEIGLAFGKDREAFTIRKDAFRIIKDPPISQDINHPDIAIMIIPPNKVGPIKAKKSFWDINLWSSKVSYSTPNVKDNVWIASGCIGEYSRIEKNNQAHELTYCLHHTTGFAGIGKYEIIDNHDYIDILVSYDELSESPASFGGLSGGGVWYSVLRKKENAPIIHDRPQLMGLVFYQSAIENGERKILCHGPRSVYKTLPILIDNN